MLSQTGVVWAQVDTQGTAQGTYANGLAEDLVISATIGGRLDAPSATETTPVGIMTLRFDSCSSGRLDYQLDTDGRSGSIDIGRLLPASEALCQALSDTQ